jgi:hypothetical protein
MFAFFGSTTKYPVITPGTANNFGPGPGFEHTHYSANIYWDHTEVWRCEHPHPSTWDGYEDAVNCAKQQLSA